MSDSTSSTVQHATGSAGGSGSDSTDAEANCAEPVPGIGSGTFYPACAAGISKVSGPGVPADFHGTIQNTMPLSTEEQAAVVEARALAAARAPAGEAPVNLGFPKVGP